MKERVIAIHSNPMAVDRVKKHFYTLLEPLMALLKERQMPAVALTDKANLFGAIASTKTV